MRSLVIETATEACSVALLEGDTLLGGTYHQLGRGHAEQLIPMISALPGQGRADRILVSLGPGSFTGIRVGLAAARSLALVWQAELAGYSTLALVAAMARRQHGAQDIAVAMTGGHGEWFVQQYDAGGLAYGAVQSLAPGAAAAAMTAPLVAGSQAEALVAQRQSGQAQPLLPDARALLVLDPSAFLLDVAPVYGRGPDARALKEQIA